MQYTTYAPSHMCGGQLAPIRPARESQLMVRLERSHIGYGLEPDSSGQSCYLYESLIDTVNDILDGEDLQR